MSRKTLVFILISFVILILVMIVPVSVYARHRRVLGVSTESALPQLPPTVEGPGLILPDSPFFFLDQVKQAIRLFFAFNPQDKAKIHNAVAGERLAELRLMLLRQNQNGIKIALEGVSENLQKSAENLNTAQLFGKDITEIARQINNDIKRRQEILDVLENEAEGQLRLMVSIAQESILQSKMKVEDGLPNDELENEIRNDLDREIERRVRNTTDSARELEDSLDELNRQASEAAQKALGRRKEALKHAIELKNEALKKIQEKLLENEKKKQEKLLEAQKKAAEQAKETIDKAQEAAKKFQEIQKEINKIEQQSTSDSSESNNESSTKGSSNSGSGSNTSSSDSNLSSNEDHGESTGRSEGSD